ncbi:MAG: Rne/Rng family ribonuclease [Planctomycetes bacterium]|nr:Rne/Rng family ribonuclease [Planctomycetota bacterium]
MLVNVVEQEETRIAILESDVLEEFYIERSSRGQIVGNIYKGKITNVEPSLQAAFVEFGGPRNGFLHISDVTSDHYPDTEKNRDKGRKDFPPIQNVLRRGQEVLVQVTKEGVGTKGPALTTYISLPGRYLVMMPDGKHHGISRKIVDEEQRKRLKKTLSEMPLPKDAGFIVRTAGAERPKKDLQRDLHYLRKLWSDLSKKAKKSKAPAVIYRESELVIRALRDILPSDVTTILIDSKEAHTRVLDFLRRAMPRHRINVKLYEGNEPLFHRYKVEQEVEKTYNRKVSLDIGASIVFDQTEALVAIDVNSGKFTGEKDAEGTAFKTNMAAVPEIARQLRLRDLGGVVVIDFIDMREAKRRREVEKAFGGLLKRDRARTKALRMSPFGIIEMTRQRVRPSVRQSLYEKCPFCSGTGMLKTPESMAVNVMRLIKLKLGENSARGVEARVNPAVADYLHNEKRRDILRLEDESEKRIIVSAREGFPVEQAEVVALKGGTRESNQEGALPSYEIAGSRK